MPEQKESGFIVSGLDKQPLQIPIELIMAQNKLGITAVMVWVNMAFFIEQNRPLNINLLSEAMGVSTKEIKKALAKLADFGWLNDEGYKIKLCIPLERENAGPPQQTFDETGSQTSDLLDPEHKQYEWLINFWATRVAPPTQAEVGRLLLWADKKQVADEVIAVAIEEMCNTITKPNIGYLEGMLRNWVNEGVFTYSQLLAKPYLAKILSQPHLAPIHPEAEQKWKEFFPDEFDS